MMPFEHAYADLGDVRLHYVTAGARTCCRSPGVPSPKEMAEYPLRRADGLDATVGGRTRFIAIHS